MTLPSLTPAGGVVVMVAIALGAAARTTGAGWLIVIVCGLIGAFAVGVVWPVIVTRRVRLTARAPRDATAGDTTEIAVAVTGAGVGVRLRALGPAGPPTAVTGDGVATLAHVAERRGVYDAVEIEVISAAPFGLARARRTLIVRLERAIEVAPRIAPVPPAVTAGRPEADANRPAAAGREMVRGVRPYVPGDPMRLVHWPATARRGEVVVKELERPEGRRAEIVVDLGGLPDAAERNAERAMGLACAALDEGVEVVLCTREQGGPRRATVASARDAGRRLARAVPGTPAAAGDGAAIAIGPGS